MNFEGISLFLKSIRFIYIGILLIVVNIVAFLFLVLPEKQKISQLQSNYSQQRNRIRDRQNEIRVLQHRVSALQKAEKDLQVLYMQVLSEKKVGVTEIRQELEELAGSLAVDRADVAYGYDPLPEYGLRGFNLSVPVEGSYRDIRRFINAIERSQHFLILDRVDLTAESSGRGGDSLKLNFQLSTYLRDEEIKDQPYATRRTASRP